MTVKDYIKKLFLRWASREILQQTRIEKSRMREIKARTGNVNFLDDCYMIALHEDDMFHRYHPEHRHAIRECRDPLAAREELFFAMGELDAWCEDNCEGEFAIIEADGYYKYFFKSRNDAAMFKVIWE